MTRLTASLIMAALAKTIPSLVWTKSEVLNIVKVVLRLVQQRAIPAANACRSVVNARP